MKSALGVGDKDKKKEKEKGGIFSLFGGDDKKKEEKEKEEGKEGFFTKLFHKDDDDNKGKEKKSGFAGLFVEQEGASAGGGNEGETVGGGEESGGFQGQSVGVNDGGSYGEADLSRVIFHVKMTNFSRFQLLKCDSSSNCCLWFCFRFVQ